MPTQSRNTATITVASIALVLAIAGGAVNFTRGKEEGVVAEVAASPSTSPTSTPSTVATAAASARPTGSATVAPSVTPTPSASSFQYKDGTYTAMGSYSTPAGPEDVGITLTIAGDVVTSLSSSNLATDRESKEFQRDFLAALPGKVVGKKISEVSIGKLAGSSLTSKGFTKALESIKSEAS